MRFGRDDRARDGARGRAGSLNDAPADVLDKALTLAAADGKADALRSARVDLHEDGSLLVACWRPNTNTRDGFANPVIGTARRLNHMC